jgi:hypothetical protein
MKDLSNMSISRPTAVSLLLLRGTTRFVCGIYVMAREEQCGVDATGSCQLHLVQMDDMSPLEVMMVL